MKNNLNSLRNYLISSLTQHGISEEKSKQATDAALEKIAERFRGQQIYIGKNDNLQKRNEQIIANFNGKNHVELALKHKLTVSTIYAIIKNAIKGKQTSIFNDDTK